MSLSMSFFYLKQKLFYNGIKKFNSKIKKKIKKKDGLLNILQCSHGTINFEIIGLFRIIIHTWIPFTAIVSPHTRS